MSRLAVENHEEIYVMNTDGTERTRLTDIPGYDHWPPTWSPDGTRIAFTSDGTEDNGEIYVMNSDGTGLTKLTGANLLMKCATHSRRNAERNPKALTVSR